MTRPLQALIVEDSETDAKLILRECDRAGHEVRFQRVEDAEAMRAALSRGPWDVIISDWAMPRFSARQALAVLEESGLDIPFIIVSGTIGEETAVEAMRFGARDYVLKHNLTRLPAAIERELRQHQARESQRRAEEARRASEERFRAIFEQAAVGMAELDASGSFLRANERLCEICGYNRAELLSMRWTDLVHREEAAEAGERLQRLSSGEERMLVRERRFCRKDGTVLRGRVTASRMAPGKSGTSVILLVEDVTASHHVQEALRASELRLATLFRLTLAGVIVTRLKDQIILDVNDTLVEQLGWAREEMIGHTTAELGVFADSADRSQLYRELETVGRLSPMEARMRRKTGEERDFLLAAERTELEGEACAIGAWHDITELRRADAARRETEERFRQLAEGVREVFWMTDLDKNQVLYVSPGYERVWGRSCQSVYDSPRTWMEAIHPEDRARVLDAALKRQTSGTYDEEYRIVRPDGTVRWIRDRASPLSDATGRVVRVAGVAEDITEKRGLQDQLRQAQKMEAIGSLAGGVAHDFNNLLSVILTFAEMLGDEVGPDSRMREKLEQILHAGQRAADLTRQLLAFSRKQILQPRVVDLNEVLSGMEKMLKRLIGEDIELAASPSSFPAMVNVDPGQMEQVIMNLAVNARDAMPGGGRLTIGIAPMVVDEAYASVHANVTPGPYVMLDISDTGTGMDAATQARAFEPFFTTKETGKGTGLGLSTVFGIVRQSAGTIWLESEHGKGTSVKVLLPTAVRAPAEPERQPVESDPMRGKETILLVEDEESVRKVVRSILHRAGYQVLEAQNGGEALLIFEQRASHIDLLLTDVVMPKMGGAQLAASVAATRPALRVLYMSGYTDDAVVLHGVEHSDVAFLQKPITPAALLSKVREVLGSSPRSRGAR